MPDYVTLFPMSGVQYVTNFPAFLARVGQDMDGKATLDHLHSEATGQVAVQFGTATDRVALSPTNWLIFVELEDSIVTIWIHDGTSWVAAFRYGLPEITTGDAGKAIVVNATEDGFGLGVAMPVGTVIAVAVSSPPTGFLECDGSAISRTAYADLYGEIGGWYGNGDGSTTFNLPDFRGEFLRGWDHGAGIDPDAASRTNRGDGTTGDYMGTKQACDVEAHTHSLTKYNSGDVLGNFVRSTNLASGTVTTTSYGGNETRPRNVNVMYCIKY